MAFQRLINWFIVILGIGLFLLILSKISLGELLEVIERANIRYLLVTVFVSPLITAIRTIRYGFFFPPAIGRWIGLYGAFAFMRLVNFTFPFRSGEIISLGLLKKNNFSPSIAETTPVWMLMRLTDLAALSMWLTVGLSITTLPGKLGEFLQWLRWILIIFSSVCFTSLFCLPLISSRLKNIFKVNTWIAQRISAFKEGFDQIKSINIFLRTLALASLIWGAMIILLTFVQLSFITPLYLFEACFLSILILVISLMPINAPLGIGTGEAAWTSLMLGFGISMTEAIAIAISVRLITIIMIICEGLIGFCLLLVFNRR